MVDCAVQGGSGDGSVQDRIDCVVSVLGRLLVLGKLTRLVSSEQSWDGRESIPCVDGEGEERGEGWGESWWGVDGRLCWTGSRSGGSECCSDESQCVGEMHCEM